MRHAFAGSLTALTVIVVLLAYPTWFGLFGPQHGRIVVPGEVQRRFSSDLLSPAVPTSNQLLTTPALSARGDAYSGGTFLFAPGERHNVTNGTYLGVPLALLSLIVAWRVRRRGALIIAFITVAAFIASLGPELKVAGHLTGVPMPERILAKLPLLETTIPYRYGFVMVLGAAALFALGFDRLLGAGDTSEASPRANRLLAVLVAVLVIAPLVPRTFVTHPVQVPEYFRTAAVEEIPSGSVVLTYPAPWAATSQPMIWQATAGLRYRMVGGYIFARYRGGPFSLLPNRSFTERFLIETWGVKIPGEPLPTARDVVMRNIRRDMTSWRVATIIVDPQARNAQDVLTLFSEILGRPPERRDGVAVWTNVRP